MKFVVINGSPKGDLSVSLQFCRFIAKKNPDHDFVEYHVAQKQKALNSDTAKFMEILESIRHADGIIWTFPVYVAAVHANLIWFFEKIMEKEEYRDAFKNKNTFSLSTSIHFFDHLAQDYMRAVCGDLQMNFFGKYTAEMTDLPTEVTQKSLLFFFSSFLSAIESKIQFPNRNPPLDLNLFKKFNYEPTTDNSLQSTISNKDNMVIITDIIENGEQQMVNLTKMVETVKNYCKTPVKVVNINDIHIKGGCLGCCQCGAANECVYGNSDGFREFFETTIKPASIIIFAFPLTGRYFSHRVKRFLDRSFYNTHMPVYRHKQIGYLISGPLGANNYITQMLEGHNEVHFTHGVRFITDESLNSGMIDRQLYHFTNTLIESEKQKIILPPSMLGIGGRKIFRDEIKGRLQFPFIADYKFYKKEGLFKTHKAPKGKKILRYLYNIEGFKSKVQATMKEKMVASSARVVEDC